MQAYISKTVYRAYDLGNWPLMFASRPPRYLATDRPNLWPNGASFFTYELLGVDLLLLLEMH